MKNEGAVRLGVLISGSGTNLQAIIDAIEKGSLKAEIRIVISNRVDAYGLDRAHRHRVPAKVIDHKAFKRREDFDAELITALRSAGVELVVCAGFNRLLSPVMLEAFPGRVMNIHPALSPAFPGLHAQRDAVDYGARVSGCTVFFVNEGVDVGPVIIQAAVPVYPDDSEDTLRERILAQEHRIYPEAIALYQAGQLEIRGRRVFIKNYAPEAGRAPLTNPPITR